MSFMTRVYRRVGGRQEERNAKCGINSPMNRSISRQSLRWPLRILPVIRVAGRFPMGDNSRDKVYVSPTHALHQHAYHATLRLGGQRIGLQPGDVTLTPAGVE